MIEQPALGRALRAQRRMADLSLRILSTEIGISFNTLSRIERGQAPNLEHYIIITNWLAIKYPVTAELVRTQAEDDDLMYRAGVIQCGMRDVRSATLRRQLVHDSRSQVLALAEALDWIGQ